MGKSTISMAIFNGYVSHNQRVARNKVLNKWLMGRRSLLQKVLLRQKFAVSNQKKWNTSKVFGFSLWFTNMFFLAPNLNKGTGSGVVSNKAILGLTANGFPTTPQMFEGI